MGLAGIFLSLGLLMYLVYRGLNVLVLAPILAVLMSGGLPIMATCTRVFMNALGRYVILYFPLFLLGASGGMSTALVRSASSSPRWLGRRTSPCS
jgi:H+/gluconate symporter-like permease